MIFGTLILKRKLQSIPQAAPDHERAPVLGGKTNIEE